MHPLKKIIELQKKGKPVGIYSACSAHPLVLEACMEKAKETDSLLLIEATANQVDQYGGYTGMKPKDFMNFIISLAKKVGLDMRQIVLGGDHLGPLTFSHLDEKEAMEEAKELVKQFVLAGFSKIHLDTSMKLKSDDPNTRLSDEKIAQRGAILCKVCEQAYKELLNDNKDALHPVYIVGSEVPIPGGMQAGGLDEMQVTKVADFEKTVKTFEKAFLSYGLKDAWEYVIAVVVQPGVEEKDSGCTEYDRKKAYDLMQAIKKYPNLVYEGHSTDYQTKIKLKELVEDGVGILKVGPGLTFMLREALFALTYAEKELFPKEKQSNLIEVLEKVMLEQPKYWQRHYVGTENEIAFKRKFSFSDRCRYYWPNEEVGKALEVLFENFKDGVKLNLLSQFLPRQYTKVREGVIKNDPKEIVKDHIKDTIDEYLYASNQHLLK